MDDLQLIGFHSKYTECLNFIRFIFISIIGSLCNTLYNFVCREFVSNGSSFFLLDQTDTKTRFLFAK